MVRHYFIIMFNIDIDTQNIFRKLEIIWLLKFKEILEMFELKKNSIIKKKFICIFEEILLRFLELLRNG
jgi:hypothetical protein